MIRDDALHTLVSSGLSPADSKQFLKAVYALGILEEPKTVGELTRDAFCGTKWNPDIAGELPGMLARVGLKIVKA